MVNDGTVDSLPDEVVITVVGPVELLAQLQNDLAAMNLDKGVSNGLAAKVDTAVKKLADKNVKNNVAAVNTLQAFVNAVNAQRGKKITQETGGLFSRGRTKNHRTAEYIGNRVGSKAATPYKIKEHAKA